MIGANTRAWNEWTRVQCFHFRRNSMSELSILGVLLLLILFAIVFALFARLHEEAIFYIT